MIGYFHKACGTLVFCAEKPFKAGDVFSSKGCSIEVNGRPVRPLNQRLRCPNEMCFAPIGPESRFFDVKST